MTQVNLNQHPYYNDYLGNKNFHQILFKPGFAVQARELTQLQTMLQEQVKRFGDNMYKNGTVIFGMNVSLNLKQNYVKILDQDSNSSTVTNDSLPAFIGRYFIGRTTGVRALVKYVAPGLVASVPDLKTLYIDYVSSGTTGTAKTFTPGEILECEDDATKTFVIPADTATYFSVGKGSFVTVDDGIVYADGHFVLHQSQTLPLEKYATAPSFKVGYRLKEEIVTVNEDLSLLDPARGSFNYAAPGADRLKITTVLSRIPLTDNPDSSFYLLYEIELGQVKRKYNKTQYGELRKELARRTYDESGSYTVKSFPILVREHLRITNPDNGGLVEAVAAPNQAKGGSKNLLAVGIEAGKAYVGGYEYETFKTEYVFVNKGISTRTYDQQIVSTVYGNYFDCNEVCGNWDTELGSTIILAKTSTGLNAITSGNYGDATAPTGPNQIGTARVHSVRHISGNPGTAAAVFRIYLYDVVLTSDSITAVTALYQAAGKCFADVVTPSLGLVESSLNDMLFRVPARAIKTFAPGGVLANNYTYRKKITGTIASGASTCTLTLPSDEIWSFSEITQSILDAKFYATIAASTGSVSGSLHNGTTLYLRPIASAGSGVRTITYDTNTQLTLGMGETFAAGATVTVWVDVQKNNVRPILKTIKKHRYVKIDTNTHSATSNGPWDLGVSDVYQIEGIWAGTYVGATPGTYLESNPDVTNQFVLDNGQRDNSYNHGRLLKANDATISFTDRNLLVKLSYFTHDYTTSGDRRYMTVDSYPVDDTGLSPDTSIFTWEIPTYTSITTGSVYDLRDTVDFRPRISDTATETTVIASATINPAASTSYVLGTNYMVPLPDGNFTTDVEFYVGRKDRIAIDDEGNFIAIGGTPSLNPIEPAAQDHTMSLALISIPAYPSLSPQAARQIGRPELSVSIKTFDNRRYTMRDIGAIEQRVNRLEYYTSLSLLEKAASDLLIPTSGGVDRFKNGILVDSFTGHNVGNVFHTDYHCAIDPVARELRPFFLLENTDLIFSNYSTNVARKPADAQIYVTASSNYTVGETVSISGASAKVVHNVRIDSTHVRLYVENVVGTFTNATLTGGTSGTTGTITSVVTPQDGHLVTLPYEHKVLAQNKFASKPRNVVSQLLFIYNGEITLDPPQDTWTDTTTQPDVQINFDGNLDAWQNLAEAWGTQWGDWETEWTGSEESKETQLHGNVSIQGNQLYQTVNEVKTTTTTQRQTRQGMQISVTPDTQIERLGAKVKNTSIVPFMRSISVFFLGERLKPNTVVYPFFDGEPVAEFCKPLNTAALYDPANHPASQAHAVLSTQFINGPFGGTLKTDANGRVAGVFVIPANRFRVGTKPFRLVDDVKNRSNFATTAAIENFSANGLSQSVEDTVISTRIPRLSTKTLSDSRTVKDSTSTESVVGNRLVGTIQNTTVNNTYNTINNTTIIVDNLIGDAPPIDPPPCLDCDTEWEVPEVVLIEPPNPWEGEPPVEQVGPPPDDTVNEVLRDGQFTSGGGGGPSGYKNRILDEDYVNRNTEYDDWDWQACDPTAQTFFVAGMPFGTFITKIDLYFKSKSTNLPITLQIREVVNGYPGSTIVPFGSCTLYPSDINVSEDASVATEFAFPSPVFLQNNVEYCFVALPAGNNPDYEIWVSELGEETIGTVPVQRISEQPFSGVLFVSANNNTWTAVQAEDVKFTIYRADFPINTNGSIFLKNAPIDYLNLTLASGTVVPGDTVSSVLATTSASGTGITATIGFAAQDVAPYAVGSSIVVSGVTPAGYNGTQVVTACTTSSVSFASTATGAQTVAGTVTGQQGIVQTYDTTAGVAKVYVTSGVFTDVTNVKIGSSGYAATINDIENKLVNAMSLNAGYVEYTPNTSTWGYRATDSDGTGDTFFSAFAPGKTVELAREKAVFSYSNEKSDLALPTAEGSLMHRVDLFTQTSTVSPMLDLRKTSAILVANEVNNDVTGETANGGAAASKYISRQVVLDEGQDAEDMLVYLTLNNPTGSSIQVYAKLLNGSDSSDFESRPWTLLDVKSQPTGTQTATTFAEWSFGLPASVLTGGGGVYQYTSGGSTFTSYKTFAVKIVLLSTNTSAVPRVKDLRVIALQV